jgi:hypothetical protein
MTHLQGEWWGEEEEAKEKEAEEEEIPRWSSDCSQ